MGLDARPHHKMHSSYSRIKHHHFLNLLPISIHSSSFSFSSFSRMNRPEALSGHLLPVCWLFWLGARCSAQHVHRHRAPRHYGYKMPTFLQQTVRISHVGRFLQFSDFMHLHSNYSMLRWRSVIAEGSGGGGLSCVSVFRSPAANLQPTAACHL